ncbi:MAG: hypothetical protein JW708_09235, partial [Vallitaleaceae bacterium]|nr:hypothetical protein [Vallitaleaceae bacterium]
MKREKYSYRSVSVPGGGFVTGFVFHPKQKDLLYLRTDIGGCYRYDFENRKWISLVDQATDLDVWETYPLSIALDAMNPNRVYSMVGLSPIHRIGISEDYGRTWRYEEAPVVDDKGNTASIHGNAPGRSTGERFIVDPYNSNIIYMGTMENGLFRSLDRCKSWEKIAVPSHEAFCEKNIAFVEIDPFAGTVEIKEGVIGARRIVVATSGEKGSKSDMVRGQSVYISHNGGKNFIALSKEPEPILFGEKDYPGYVGQRACFTKEFLYITYASYNIGWSTWDSYGCDTGKCSDGALFRFRWDETDQVKEALDLTPEKKTKEAFRLGYGLSGIQVNPQQPEVVICSTITSAPDKIYISKDAGLTWTPILSGLEVGHIDFNVSYQQPQYNGNGSLIHWISDLKINPFNPNMLVFNTGAGVFVSKNLMEGREGKEVQWACFDEGIEETVHLNIYSPPSGEVHLIDIIGDYGGFAFRTPNLLAENTFANENKDRWITCMNADFPDEDPNYLVTTPRGNWTGKTSGGLIVSRDQGLSWKQLKNPEGLGSFIEQWVRELKRPNVTSGWTAVSSDGKTILWGLGLPIYSSRLVYTHNEGENWNRSILYDLAGDEIMENDLEFKVFSDRVHPNVFYGFSENQKGRGFFVSTDRGEIFRQLQAPKDFPEVNLAGIDSEQKYEIRVQSKKSGRIYLAMVEDGLWKLDYDLINQKLMGEKLTKEGDWIKRFGIGKGEEGKSVDAFYTSGRISGEYGFFRSHDEGNSWTRINDDTHQFGDIRSITGDPRIYGRIYIATGTRGLICGDPDTF